MSNKLRFVALCAMVFGLGAASLQAQTTGMIRGSVRDGVTGRPLQGAQLTIMGTSQGALSNDQGEFLLLGVPAGTQTIRVLYIGYRTYEQTLEVAAGETSTVSFQMGQAAIDLDEIVVTGTAGATEKRALGNTVSRVSSERIVADAKLNSVSELLTARVPGLSLQGMSGQVGTSSRVRIRGAGSLNAGNEPVYYVDGVRITSDVTDGYSTSNGVVQGTNPLDAINPNDIESIEVIKGPAAATLYGAEAAAGVIQVITKKGKAGQGVQFAPELQAGQNDWHNEMPMNYTLCTATGDAAALGMSTSQFNTYFGNRIGSTSWPGCANYNASQPLADRVLTDQPALRDPRAFRTGNLSGGNVSVRGGGDSYNFYLSGERSNEEGVYFNNFEDRQGARMNFGLIPSEKLNFSISTSYTRTNIRMPIANNGSNGILRNAFRGQPGRSSTWGEDGIGWRGFTPEISNQYDNRSFTERTILSLTTNYHPFPWLENKLTVGLDKMDRSDTQFYPQDTTGAAPWGADQANGWIGIYMPNRHMWTVDYTGTVKKPINDNVGSRFSAGMQLISRQTDWHETVGWGLITDQINVISSAENRQAYSGYSEQSSLGFFGQEQVDWQNRIFATVALRVDDNSAFGRDFSLVYYPKASLSWMMSEENFWNVEWLQQFKLRLAYGKAGKAPGPGEADRTFSPGQTAVDDVVVNRIFGGEYGNANLKAETGSEYEAGFDAALLDGRMGVEFTYYNKHTQDALVAVSDPPSSGFSGTHLTNIGEVVNDGLELLVTGTPVYTKDFQWDASLTFSTNHNKLITFGTETIPEISFGDFAVVQKHIPGYPLGGFWSLDVERDGNGVPVIRDSQRNIVSDASMGNVTVLPDSMKTYLGPSLPTREVSLASTFTLFNNVRVFANFDYKGGNYQWCAMCSIRARSDRNAYEINSPDTDPKDRLAFYSLQTQSWLAQADFIKLRELAVTLSLPQAWASQFNASSASLTLSGRNLWMWTKYFDGFDPEVVFNSDQGGTRAFASSDYASTPQIRRLAASVRFVF